MTFFAQIFFCILCFETCFLIKKVHVFLVFGTFFSIFFNKDEFSIKE